MKRIVKGALCALVLAGIFAGCDIQGYVTDQNKQDTQVTHMSICDGHPVRIVSGGAVKDVPLEAFSVITITNDETRSIGGELYFCASVTFRDGSKLDARNKENAPITFVNVGASLCGESEKGTFSIGLANVSRVSFSYK